MEIVELERMTPEHLVDAYDSEGFSIEHLSRTASVAIARIDPGGRIGRHPAIKDQAMIMLAGTAQVSGTDTSPLEIGPRQAAVWRGGEWHETLALTTVTALIVEGDDLHLTESQNSPGSLAATPPRSARRARTRYDNGAT